MEWSLDSQEVSLNVNLGARAAVWHQLDVLDPSDDGREEDLNLDEVSDWDWLSQEVLLLTAETT